MSMYEWAEREVKLACERENPNLKEGEWDYGCACYESALKAYKSLCDDGHSGMSFSFTRCILNRLMNGLPLTPIEDTPDIWGKCDFHGDDPSRTIYQCKRKSSLFKNVESDGRVWYNDIDRVRCVNPDNPDVSWHSNLAAKLVDERFPITMPYIPEEKPFIVSSYEYLSDRKNGDFDTVHFISITKPDGEVVELTCKYFGKINGHWQEIGRAEFKKRMLMHGLREAAENKEVETYEKDRCE